MTDELYKARVYSVVSAVLGAPESEINDDAGPDTLPNWDSVSHLNLVLALEEEFGVTFTDDDVTDMISVGLVCRIVQERLDSDTAFKPA